MGVDRVVRESGAGQRRQVPDQGLFVQDRPDNTAAQGAGAHVTPKVGGGRPWGPIHTENPAARKLAETLRRHVDGSGKTLPVLSDEISMSKSQTGVYLAGKVPAEAFVVALIRKTVRPELRQRRQEEALALREQAMRPAPRTTPGTPVTAGPGAGYAIELAAAQAQQIETYDRLTRTLEQRAEVERAKNNSDKLAMVLLNMIHQLDRRVTDLAKERDQLLARPRSDALEDAERKLARAEEQEQRARAELRRAEEKQRQAEDLEARVTDQLRRLTDELDRLRAGDTTSPLDTLPALAGEAAAGLVSADPVGDDIDAVLARASQVNAEDNTTLNRVTSELNEPTAGVVQDNSPDNLAVLAGRSVSAASPLPGVPDEGQEAVRALLRRSPAPDLFVRFLDEATRWENVQVHGIKRQNSQPGASLDYSRYLGLRRQGSQFGGFAYVYAENSRITLRLHRTRDQLDAIGATRARTRVTAHRGVPRQHRSDRRNKPHPSTPPRRAGLRSDLSIQEGPPQPRPAAGSPNQTPFRNSSVEARPPGPPPGGGSGARGRNRSRQRRRLRQDHSGCGEWQGGPGDWSDGEDRVALRVWPHGCAAGEPVRPER